MKKRRNILFLILIYILMFLGKKITVVADYAMFEDHYVIGSVYLCESYEVMDMPSYDGEIVATVLSGQTVQIINEVENEYGEIWTEIFFYVEDEEKTGFIERLYLACSDELFLLWEEAHFTEVPTLQNYNQMSYGTMAMGLDEEGENLQNLYPDIDQFPESYREALTALKEAHPNWTFVVQNTGLDWNTVLNNELVAGRSLIPTSYPEYMSAGAYGTAWKNANRETLSYYIDPRNGLTEENIFQFEQLTYNASYHVEASIQSFLNNTFMRGTIPGDANRTYANVFWTVGSQLGVSPFHLASRVYQEQGQGTSAMISGTYPGFEGYYNYFNIGATGKTNQEVLNTGLTYAKNQNWNSVLASITGGGYFISKNYILKGQDTIYLQKFDVDNTASGMYWHQYMQNIVAPTSEAKTVKKQYADAGSLENTFVFKIPVYKNMPSLACAKPNGYKLSISKPAGYSLNKLVIDGIEYEANELSGNLTLYLSNGNSKVVEMYQYTESGVPVGMKVYTLSYDSTNQYVATLQSDFDNLLSYHGFSMRITGNTGLRAEMGISGEVRDRLISDTGINGYRLKTYGTLLMNKANIASYPLIVGGAKVGSAVAYGNSNGSFVDNIFRTVDGRHHFTAVLTGIPVANYKQEIVFRSFIVLTKDGQDIVIYGPSVSKSLYRLATQLLEKGTYPEGSDPYIFLKQIIDDADALDGEE